MTKIEPSKHIIYLERARECYNAYKILEEVHSLKYCDVFFMLYSIGVISVVNSITIKYLGEKGKDHKDMHFYKESKKYIRGLDRWDSLVFEVNSIKHSSEYGDTHHRNVPRIEKLKEFIQFAENN